MLIPFNKISTVGNEEKYVLESLHSGKWCGRGPMTQKLEALAREKCQSKYAFFVTSCTSALEISCLLSDVGPGDEVILPSFGFVSAANAIMLRGAKPVFADVELETWNLSEKTVSPLLCEKTKAVLTVHYAGSTEGVDGLRGLCHSNKISLIEDAAQSLGSTQNGRPVGSTPFSTCFSLHETKNISSGEGGLLTTDNEKIAEKVEIIIEKGTNRQKFFRGQVDKYTWVDMGSSYLASDILAAIALAQMEKLEIVTRRRREIFTRVKNSLHEFEGRVFWQKVGKNCETNGHILGFRVDPFKRDGILKKLKEVGIVAQFHYVPLHNSPFAIENDLVPVGKMEFTNIISEGLIRLPIFYSMNDQEVDYLIDRTQQVLRASL